MSTTDVKGASEDVRFVAREGGWAGLLGAAGAGCRYLNSIILARVLGSESYGVYALANTIVSLLAMPANLGLPISTVHFVAAYEGTGEWAKLRWVIRTSLRLVVISSVAWTVLIVLLAPWSSGAIFRKERLILPLGVLALALPLLGVNAVCAGGLQGLKMIRAKVFAERIAHPAVFSVLLVAGGFYFRNLGYVLACYVAAALLVALLGARWLANRLRSVPRADTSREPPWKELFRFATPVMFLNILNYFILWSDVLVMGMFRPLAEVGVYTVASRLAVAVNQPTEALSASLAPGFAGMSSRGELQDLKATYHTATRWIFGLSAAIGLVLLFGGRAVLWLFGRDFGAAYPALCLLAAGQIVSAATGPNGLLLTMTGYPQFNLGNAICFGLANLGLNFILVPTYGAIGAAAAAASSVVLVNAARSAEIWYLYRTIPWDRTVLNPIGAFVLAAAAGGATYWIVGPASAAVAIAVYVLAWWLSGPEPEDLDLLRRFRARLRNAGPR